MGDLLAARGSVIYADRRGIRFQCFVDGFDDLVQGGEQRLGIGDGQLLEVGYVCPGDDQNVASGQRVLVEQREGLVVLEDDVGRDGSVHNPA